MNEKTNSVLGPIKRIILLVMMAIFSILLCFAFQQQAAVHKENEDKVLINVFGRQRMYTQMLSKDANLLYALVQANEQDEIYQSEDDINKRITAVKANLLLVSKEFSDTLAAINNGKVMIEDDVIHINASSIKVSKLLPELNQSWEKFSLELNRIAEAEKIDADMAEATLYVNENNRKLLELCDKLLDHLLKDSIQTANRTAVITYGLVGLLFIAIILAMFQLWRYLLQPFSQLYKGIAEIGLENYPVNLSFPTRKKVMPIVSEISDMFNKIEYLISLIESMNNNASTMQILNYLSRTFTSFLPFNYIGIALIDEDKKVLRASYGVSDGSIVGLPEQIMGATWPISDTSLEVLLETGEARIINDLEEYTTGKTMKSYNKVLLDAGIKASITLPLSVNGDPVGMIFFSSGRKNVYKEEHLKFLRTLANSIAISLNQNIFISDVLYSGILALAKLAEARDEDTGEHLDRMKQYSRMLASLLYEKDRYTEEINMEYIDHIERFSPLHDIGKVGIRDGILLKPGKLTTDEYEEMKKHAAYGAEVLRSAEKNMQKKGKRLFHMGIEIAEGHHEKWDGSGYPYGKKGEEIPLSARIVAVADVFDALTSRRPYKEPFSFEKSIDIIKEGQGKHFDPVIVEVLLENRDRMEQMYHSFRLMEETKELV